MASEERLAKGALRVLADLQRKVASGDVRIHDVQQLLNKPPTQKWDGDVSKLILPPEKQVQAWERYIHARGYHTGQNPELMKDVPEPPTLSEQDIADGYQGVCLFYGWPKRGDKGEDVNVANSALFGWEEINMRFAHHASRCVVFKDGLLKLRAGAKKRPVGWFWRKINLMPRNRKKRLYDITVGINESMLSFEWFQFAGITHTYFVDYMCAFPEDQFGVREFQRNRKALKRMLGDKLLTDEPRKMPELPTQLLGDLSTASLPSRADDNDWEQFSGGGFIRFGARREHGIANVDLSVLPSNGPFAGQSPGVYGLLRD